MQAVFSVSPVFTLELVAAVLEDRHTTSGYIRRHRCSGCSMRTTHISEVDGAPRCGRCEDPSNA